MCRQREMHPNLPNDVTEVPVIRICMLSRALSQRLLPTCGRCLPDDTWRTCSRNMLPLARNGHTISLNQSSSQGALGSMLRAWQARGGQARQVRCSCVAAGQSKYVRLCICTAHPTTGTSAKISLRCECRHRCVRFVQLSPTALLALPVRMLATVSVWPD